MDSTPDLDFWDVQNIVREVGKLAEEIEVPEPIISKFSLYVPEAAMIEGATTSVRFITYPAIIALYGRAASPQERGVLCALADCVNQMIETASRLEHKIEFRISEGLFSDGGPGNWPPPNFTPNYRDSCGRPLTSEEYELLEKLEVLLYEFTMTSRHLQLPLRLDPQFPAQGRPRDFISPRRTPDSRRYEEF